MPKFTVFPWVDNIKVLDREEGYKYILYFNVLFVVLIRTNQMGFNNILDIYLNTRSN